MANISLAYGYKFCNEKECYWRKQCVMGLFGSMQSDGQV